MCSRLRTRALPLLLGALAATGLAACGSNAHVSTPPRAGIVKGAPGARGGGVKPDTSNPSASLIACLGQHRVGAHQAAPDDVAVDPPEAGIHVRFLGTDGDAQAEQIRGGADGAEVILNALLYTGRGTDAQLKTVESCVANVAK